MPTRREFLRSAGVLVGAAAVAPNLLLRAARAAGAPPMNAHLAFGADPRTQMSFVWSTPGPVDQPRLSFGALDGAGTTVMAETRPLPRNLLNPALTVPTHYHHVRLSGLTPGTTYEYRVEHTGAPTGLTRTFTTAPAARAPFTFTAFGDQGVSSAGQRVVGLVAGVAPAFNLIAGDLCYADGSGSTLPIDIGNYHPDVWDGWFAQAMVSAAQVPWMPSMGNHDVEPGYGYIGYNAHASRLALPESGFNDVVYSFRYGNVAVVALDANDVSLELPHPYSAGRQTQWLDAELTRLRADPSVDFIVAFFHHCAYCTITSHGSDAGVRSAWVPLFDKHDVDLVINGHNHGYERTTPVRNGAPTERGTTYICAGGGGRSPNTLSKPGEGFVSLTPALHEPEKAPWSAKAVANNSFLRVDVDPGGETTTMTITAIDSNGYAFDNVVLTRASRLAASPAGSTTTVASGAYAMTEIPATGGTANLALPGALIVGAAAVNVMRRVATDCRQTG